MDHTYNRTVLQIRRILLLFMIALFFSGLTAIPLDAELSFLLRFMKEGTSLHHWFERVRDAYRVTTDTYPFIAYGYDWLAFAHFVLTILFIGPYRDPVKNIWVIEFGMIACVLVFPLALIAGPFRGIPLGWRLIDCSFGALGIIPLYICHRKTTTLIKIVKTNQA